MPYCDITITSQAPLHPDRDRVTVGMLQQPELQGPVVSSFDSEQSLAKWTEAKDHL